MDLVPMAIWVPGHLSIWQNGENWSWNLAQHGRKSPNAKFQLNQSSNLAILPLLPLATGAPGTSPLGQNGEKRTMGSCSAWSKSPVYKVPAQTEQYWALFWRGCLTSVNQVPKLFKWGSTSGPIKKRIWRCTIEARKELAIKKSRRLV